MLPIMLILVLIPELIATTQRPHTQDLVHPRSLQP